MTSDSPALFGLTPFLDKIFKTLSSAGLDVKNYVMDHACYRVSSLKEYESAKTEFAKIATLLHEAQISGRPIATYKLREAIEHEGRDLDCIELPAPKQGKQTVTGWEHVEFVIDESFSDFMSRYSALAFDTSGISKTHNPEIVLSFGDCAVKFHHVALEEVVRREK